MQYVDIDGAGVETSGTLLDFSPAGPVLNHKHNKNTKTAQTVNLMGMLKRAHGLEGSNDPPSPGSRRHEKRGVVNGRLLRY